MPTPKITKTRAIVAGAGLAAAVAIGVAVSGNDPAPEAIEDVASITADGGAGGGYVGPRTDRAGRPLPPKESDADEDGLQDTLDPCPWNAGPLDGTKPGCP